MFASNSLGELFPQSFIPCSGQDLRCSDFRPSLLGKRIGTVSGFSILQQLLVYLHIYICFIVRLARPPYTLRDWARKIPTGKDRQERLDDFKNGVDDKEIYV